MNEIIPDIHDHLNGKCILLFGNKLKTSHLPFLNHYLRTKYNKKKIVLLFWRKSISTRYLKKSTLFWYINQEMDSIFKNSYFKKLQKIL
jgi:hypothetical protein